jgi:hypothetical protein
MGKWQQMLETDYFMTPLGVADFLLMDSKTLANWRSIGKGPAFSRFGN